MLAHHFDVRPRAVSAFFSGLIFEVSDRLSDKKTKSFQGRFFGLIVFDLFDGKIDRSPIPQIPEKLFKSALNGPRPASLPNVGAEATANIILKCLRGIWYYDYTGDIGAHL